MAKNKYAVKTKPRDRDGFFMNVTPEERAMIEELKRDYAINLSQAFKLFLRQMFEKRRKEGI